MKKKILKLLGNVAEQQATGAEGWPPTCVGIFYQPKRPTSKKSTENK